MCVCVCECVCILSQEVLNSKHVKALSDLKTELSMLLKHINLLAKDKHIIILL